VILEQIPIYNNKNIDISTGEVLLGTNTKSVANDGSSRRDLRYKMQGCARKLLPTERVAKCMLRCGQGGVSVNVATDTGIAFFSGVAACGSVWLCPVCSAKISNGRRKELNTVLAWARELGYQPVLMTLTARHGVSDSLAGCLAAMKLAKKKLHQSREWKALDPNLIGHITATEVTHGANGWHVHYHVILLVVASSQDLAIEMCDLQAVWLRCLNHKAVMLGGNGFAYDVQGAGGAGDYVSKWGAGEEVTLTGSKKANGKGNTPFQLLSLAAAHADTEEGQSAAQLFIEYAKEFKGKRQLVWSRGLKKVLNIIEKSDEAIADEPDTEDYIEIARVERSSWRVVMYRGLQSELLKVAEEYGSFGVEMWLIALENQERIKNGSNSTQR
jgi:hypothetical protein